MTKQTNDDLEAVRVVVEALKAFERDEQERIIRWAREKLGLTQTLVSATDSTSAVSVAPVPVRVPGQLDLRGFVAQKNPRSDTHFAATVAYYYRFEAPEAERKETITSTDLLEACRLADRHRLKNPLLTLNNAHRDGLLNRGPERGTFTVNSVGENLVAMALPTADGTSIARRPSTKKRSSARKKKR